ncbi:hypothetical protein HMPREF9003_2113 [Bifidobacterium dentium JCVIHMP022]|uniref:Uncharacterized protein n=1 Tax=Bifidobacterium dentium JCVIHMP022 TaxID=553191 RepID=A0AB72Z5A4_9BIFI|nr:hypothetical protein HMPREF9003_2113 [Bifidobacterium dentium JCVIHMP022]
MPGGGAELCDLRHRCPFHLFRSPPIRETKRKGRSLSSTAPCRITASRGAHQS